MISENIKSSFTEVPFKSSLSFEYLIREIQTISDSENHALQESAKTILKKLNTVKELKKPIKDFSLVKKNQKLIDKMMAYVYNPLSGDMEMSSVSAPFFPKPFYWTRMFDEVIRGENKKLEIAKDIDENGMLLAIIYQAYLIILQKFYDFDFKFDVPYIFKLKDNKENSVKYFKAFVNPQYSDIKIQGKLRKLSKQELKKLFDNATDLDYWNEMIPLKNFEFIGFLKFTFVDITHEYVISQLKSDLLDKHSIVSQQGFERIRQKVGALMDLPDLQFGLAAFGDFEANINQDVIWKSIIPQSDLKCDEYIGTLYEEAYREKRIILTDDMAELEENKMVSAFLKKGIRSHAIVPLIFEDEIVGMIEFGVKEPGRLNSVQIKRFYELFPVFAIALKRSKEEMNNRIQAIIQEECTAIHPTVEWRFWEAATNMLNGGEENAKMEPILFSDVVPIYGASDIRNSSIERSNAIQSDLSEHLNLAKKIMTKGIKGKEMPLLDHITYKIDKNLKTVNSGLKAGDEVSILEFIRNDIEPVFKQLKDRDSNMAREVNLYFSKMDPELGVIYNKRKDFEDSLTLINNRVGEIIDEEQVKAQLVFPHYFEKYRTDGVEYNAYIGQSMVKDLNYDPIYLKNIRLWQLMVKAKIAREVKTLKPTLKNKLDVTQLILVHSNPLSIAFRQDEKKFDVAGAYNIRYEITKKRIDKAVIKGTNERVTQVGKIAIIYSHSEEIEEYKKYIDYMIAKGYLKDTIEDLELEDMKGASGLRALRVEVDFGPKASTIDEINISEIKKVIENN